MLNDRREENCFAITHERKYYHVGKTFVKRSLRPREWKMSYTGKTDIPRQGRERALNEAASLTFVRENSAIPVPTLHCCFEDDDAVYLVMEYIDGVEFSVNIVWDTCADRRYTRPGHTDTSPSSASSTFST